MKDILREHQEDHLNDGIARRVTRDSIMDAYSQISAREREKRREERDCAWIRTGDRNIMKSNFLPKLPRQEPRR